MLASAMMAGFREPEMPHRSFGSGKIIRPDSYGHVEVSVFPRFDSSDLSVEWNVKGGSIPSDQRKPVIDASQRVLDAAAAEGRLRCGVCLIIERGSFHDSLRFAHVEAAGSAVIDTLERGKFLREKGND